MCQRILGVSDLVLAALAALVGIGLMLYLNQKLDGSAASALAGALFGCAALLIGNWINRRAALQRDRVDSERRRSAMTTMIAAELVNVVAGHISAMDIVDSAIIAMRVGGNVGDHLDMTPYMPRAMPFTDGLSVEIFALNQTTIDALAALRSNLAITRMSMNAITKGRDRFSLSQVASLASAIRHDMAILATIFAFVAPTRKLSLPGKPAELATAILQRLSVPLAG
jgi:hypothetical protein